MRSLILAAALSVAGIAHAQTEAYSGIAADGATTAIGLSQGFAEANPLSWATLPIRAAIVAHCNAQSAEEGKPCVQAIAATSWGLALSNLLLVLGAGFAAPIAGIALMTVLWRQDSDEREFLAMCARIKTAEQKCVWRAA